MGVGLTNPEVADVYRSYGHLVQRRCRMVLRSAALADDATQNVFIKVMRYGSELHKAESKLRWLYRVSDRCCFDLLRRQKRRAESSDVVDEAGPHPSVDLEARSVALSILGALDDDERTIAVLAYVDGMSQGDIATETGWSRQTINKKLARIRERAERAREARHG